MVIQITKQVGRSYQNHLINMEFLSEGAGKNLHLEHLEDEILNFGVAGGRSAINFLRSLRDMFAGDNKKKLNVTVKWDGAPAIFAGPHPETGEFFVAKKSLFNKTPKYYTSIAEINSDLDGDLASKFRTSFIEFSKLDMTEILQGDLMFTKEDLATMDLEGVSHYTFQPNTILYAVEKDSKIGEEIKKANIGIVWHTTYKGKTIQDLSASFGAKLPKKISSVWQDDATFRDVSGKGKFTLKETAKVTKALSSAGKQFHQINSSSFSNYLRWEESLGNSAAGAKFKTYLNTFTREGKKLPKGRAAVKFYQQHFTKWWKKNKSQKLQSDLQEHLRFIRKSEKTLESVVDFMRFLVEAKMMIIKKMNEAKGLAKTFVRTPNGLKVVNPEGYVAIDHTGGAVKIVDKLEFSFNNFTVAKNWDK